MAPARPSPVARAARLTLLRRGALFPFYALPPQGALGPKVQMKAYVPMDDEHTLQWGIFVNVEEQASEPALNLCRPRGR